MRITFDCRDLTLYPVGKPGFHGGTETLVEVLARGLAGKGHTVHVITPDLDLEEQRGPTEWWWGPGMFPARADLLVPVSTMTDDLGRFDFGGIVYLTNGTELPRPLPPEVAAIVSAYPVFSQTHARLLCALNPSVHPERCVVTGLGVDLEDYTGAEPEFPLPWLDSWKKPGRIWVGNDPARGLLHTLDVFDLVRKEYPEASLHVTYDFDRQFEAMRWRQNAMAEMFWEMKRRLENTPGVVKLGSVSRADVVREQLEAQVHLWPSDPPNVGSQIHGLAQAEAAAAGCALVLSDVEAFPEIFGGVADILPVPGTYIADPEGDGYRVDAQDWAEVVLDLFQDQEKWARASKASRALAEKMTWQSVVDNWHALVEMLASGDVAPTLATDDVAD